MYFLYSLALLIVFLALSPYFVYQDLRRGKRLASFRQRMGRLPDSALNDGRPVIWVHTVSVGEFNAARPLIERIRRERADHRIVVSTVTATGQQMARSQLPAFDAVFYFPFDLTPLVRRALNHINPTAVIILETELWPNFLRECRRRKVMTIIANGRISPRSFTRYLRAKRFIARAVQDVSLLIMQSEADAERALALGARFDSVRVCGNLKYDLPAARDEKLEYERQEKDSSAAGNALSLEDQSSALDFLEEMDRYFALSSSPRVIIAGSTAPGEEKMLVAALRETRRRAGLQDTRLIIAPRHPERFDEVAVLLSQSGFSFARRSEAKARARAQAANAINETALPRFDAGVVDDAARLRAADIILLDSIGELATLYRFASVVFIGGSLVPRGGHNIIEPAVYSKPVIVGPHTENFRQIVSDFARADALVQIEATGDNLTGKLTSEIIRLLIDRQLAQAMGERARNILLANRGATQCSVAAILERIKAKS